MPKVCWASPSPLPDFQILITSKSSEEDQEKRRKEEDQGLIKELIEGSKLHSDSLEDLLGEERSTSKRVDLS